MTAVVNDELSQLVACGWFVSACDDICHSPRIAIYVDGPLVHLCRVRLICGCVYVPRVWWYVDSASASAFLQIVTECKRTLICRDKTRIIVFSYVKGSCARWTKLTKSIFLRKAFMSRERKHVSHTGCSVLTMTNISKPRSRHRCQRVNVYKREA